MNKVYKVIWCNATQTFVAVSELSKARGKSSSTTVGSVGRSILPNFKLAQLSLALITIFGLSPVYALAPVDTVETDFDSTSGGQIVILGNAKTTNANTSNGTKLGAQSINIGNDVFAEGDSSIAIGGDDTVTASNHLMRYMEYNKDGSEKVIVNKTLKELFEDTTGVTGVIAAKWPQTRTGHGAVAIGVSTQALGGLSTAFGVGAKVKKNAHLGLALGAGAVVTKINAVAIGAGATTDVEARKYKEAIVAVLDSKGKPTGKEIHYKGFSGGAENLQPGDYVSFGKKGFERQLKNVAAGKIDRDSTDAVNGSQLVSLGQAMEEKIQDLKDGGIDTYFHVNEDKGSQKEGDAVTNLGGIRDKAGAKGNYSITGGVEAVASEKFGISLGYKSSVLKRNGVALGSNSSATEEYGVSIGSYAETSNVGAVALGPSANASVERGVALGANSNADREGFASGVTVETADNATFGGNKVYAMRSALAGDKTGVVNTVSTNDTGAVSVGSAERKRQIINLAAGSEDGDAVNVAQLKAVANTTEGYFHTNDGTTTQATGDADTNLGFINEKAGATGTHSVTAGVDAKATGNFGSMALGYQASSSEDGAVAIGQESVSKGASSVAIGYDTSATNIGAIALGRKAVSDNSGIAMGNESHSQGLSGIAVGYQSVAIGDNSVAVGKLTNVVGGGSTAVGFQAKTSDRLSTALGQMAWAEGLESLAVGSFTKAAGSQSIAIGNDVHADGERTIVIGSRERGTDSYDAVNDSASSGNMAIAIGSGKTLKSNDKLAEADGDYSIALGTSAKTETTAIEGIAIGRGANVTGEKSIAIGSGNTVSGNNSGAFGDPSTISGDNSYSFGNNNTIANTNTFVLGNKVTTVTDNSVVLGNLSKDKVAVAVTEGTVNGVTYGTFAGVGAPANGVVSVGDVGKERQIVNVAPGKISATSTDAINGSQLHAVAKKSAWTLQKDGEDVDKVAGDIVNFAKGKGVSVNIIKEEGKAGKPDVNTITFDIDSKGLPQTKVAEGKNIEVTPEFDSQTGNTTYTVDGHKTTVTKGDMIDVEYTPSNNGFDHDYKISLNEDTQKKINALSNKVFGLNADNRAEQSIKLGDTINIRAGNASDTSTDNLKTEVNGSTVTISMKNKPVFEEVTADKVTINNAPTSGKDAINKKYLDDQLGNTFKLTDQSGDSTATQTLNKEGGLDFKLVGEEGIETKAVAGSNQVKIKLDTETKAKIDKVDTIETDVTTLEERKISLGGDTNSETNEQNLSKDIKFDIVGSTNSAIQTNALDDKVELKVLVDDKTIEIAKNKLQAKTTDFDPNTNGTVEADNEDALVTAGDIAKAINSSGFIAKATKSEGKVDGSRKHKVATGTTLQLDAGKNIKIKQEEGKFTFSTVDAPEFENATVKIVNLNDDNAVVNVKELKAAKKDLTDAVDNLGNNTIQLAGNGGETKTNPLNQQGGIKFNIEGESGGEIVTEAQKANKVVLKLNKATKDKLAKLDEDKNLSDKADNDLSNITDDGKKNITKLGTIVEAADNSVDVSAPEVDPTTGQKTYKVKVATTTLATDPTGKVTAPTSADATKIATAGDVANAINKASHKVKGSNSSDVITAKDGEASIKAGDQLHIEAAKNLELKMDGKKIQLTTAKTVEFDNVKVGDVELDKTTGINAGNKKIKGVAAGEDPTDAVNKKQLDDLVAISKEEVTAGDGVSVVKTDATATKGASFEVAIKTDGKTTEIDKDGNIVVKTAPLTTNTDGAVVTPTGDAAKSIATAGDVANAINNAGWNLQESGQPRDKVIAGDTVNFVDGEGTTASVVTTNDKVSVIKYDVKLDENTFEVDPATNKIKAKTTTLTPVTTGDNAGKVAEPTGADANKLVTAGDIATAINSASHKVKGTNSQLQVTKQDGVTTIATGETLEIEAGKNLVLKADAGNKKLQLSTASDVEFDKTTVGNVVTDSTTNKITGLEAGTNDKDAVNFKQLKDNAQSIASTLGGGSTVNPDGSITAPTLEVVDPVTGNNTAPTTVAGAVKNLSDAVNNPLYVKADVLEGTAKEKSSAQKLGSTLEILTGKTSDGTSGDNLETKVENGKVTISMKDNPYFEEIQAGKKDSPITIGAKNGKNVISGLESTLPTGDTNATAPTLTDAQKGQAATLGDIMNAGWNLQEDGNARDLVKPYDTVNFVDTDTVENTIVTTDNKVSEIKFNVKTTQLTTNDATGEITSPTGGDAKKLVNAGDVANAISKSGFVLTAEGQDGSVVNPGETVDMKNTDGNIVISKVDTDNDVNYDLAKELKGLTSVETVDAAGNKTVQNGAGVTITPKDATKKPVSLTKNGLDNGDNKITGVAKGDVNANSTDAVNGAQLHELAEKPISFVGNGTEADKITKKLGETLTIKGGLANDDEASDINTFVKEDNGELVIKFSDKPVFDEVTAKEGLTIGEGADAINMAPSKTKTVGGTEVPAVDMDGKTFTGLASNLPDTNTTKGEKPNDLVSSNAATLGDVLNSGWNLQVEGADADFVKPYDTVNFVAKENSGITVTEKADSTGTKTNIEIGLEKGEITSSPNAQGTNGFVTGIQVAEAINNSGFKLKAQKGDGELGTSSTTETDHELINPNDEVIIEADKNIKVTQKKGVIEIATKDTVEFDNVKVGDVELDKTKGINAGDKKITGVAPATIGDNSTDAVNGSQLKDLADQLGLTPDATGNAFATPTLTQIENADGTKSAAATNLVDGVNQVTAKVNEGINFGASNTTKGNQKLGSTLEVVASDKVAGETYSEKNLTTTYTKDADGNGKILVEMNEKPEFKEVSIEGSTVKLAKDGLDNGGNTITNVAAGDDDTDAVNVSQLKDVANQAADNNPFEYTNVDGDKLVKVGDKYFKAGSDGKPTTEEVAKTDVNVSAKGDAKPLNNIKSVIGNNNGDGAITADKAKTAVGDLLTKKGDLNQAATAGDLQALAQAGLDFAGDNGADTTIHKELGKKLDIIGGADKTKLTENNIGVNAVDGKLKVQLAKDLKGLDSVVLGDTTGDDVVSMTKNGINAGNKKLTGVAPATISDASTEAVNGSQIKGISDSIANALGGNTTVNPDGTISAPTFTLTNGNPVDGGTTTYNNVGEALNGLNEAVTKPITFKADENADTGADGSQQKLGSEFEILAGNATETSTKNLKTKVEDNKVTISMSEKPIFKEVTAEDKLTIGTGDNAIVLEPTKTTALKNGAQSPVNALDMKGSTFTGLASNVAPVTNENAVINPNFSPAQQSNAATLGDLLNTGWNLEVAGAPADFVKPYDTVNFVGKEGVTVTEKTDSTDKKTTIEVAIAKGDVTANADTGIAEAGQPDGFVTGLQVADAINSAFWKTGTGASENGGVVEPADEVKVKAGSKVEFTSGKNMKVKQVNTANGVKYVYATKDDVEFNSANIGGVEISNDGINLNDKKIKGVKKGTDDTDGVNLGQIKDISNSVANTFGGKKVVNPDGTVSTEFDVPGLTGGPFDNVGEALKGLGDELDKGHEFQGDFADASDVDGFLKRKHGERLIVKGGKTVASELTEGNIGVETFSDNTMWIKLAKDLELTAEGSVNFDGTNLDKDGLEIKDGPKFTKTDIDASGLQIHGVKAGEQGTDAVNVSQLEQAQAAAKTVVKKGDHIASVVKKDGTATTPDEYTINAKDIKSGSEGLDVVEAADKFTIDLSQANKKALENAKNGFYITADNVTNGVSDVTKDNVKLDDRPVKFTGGDNNPNIVTTVDDNEITFDLANTITVGNSNAGGKPVVINGEKGEITGLTNTTFDPSVTYNDKKAATEEQLKSAYDQVKKVGEGYADSKTFGLKGADGKKVEKAVDNVIEVVGADSNISTAVKNNKLMIKLADTLTDIKKVTGLDDHLSPVTDETKQGVKPTDLATIGKDAATINDLMNAGWNLEVAGEEKDLVTAYDTVNFEGEGPVTVTHEAKDGKQNIKIGIKKGELETDANGNVIAKPEKDGFVTTQDVADAINSTGFNLSTNGTDAKLIKSGNKVDMKNTDGNLVISHKDIVEAGKVIGQEVNYDLAKDIKVDTVVAKKGLTVGEGADAITLAPAKTTNINGVNNQPALDLGGKSITGLADNLVPTEGKQEQAAPNTNEVNGKNAATVNDVMNAGFNLKANGVAKDFVKAYDTVNFVDGNMAKVTISDTNEIKVDVDTTQLPVVYTDKEGNKVAKGKDGFWHKLNENGSLDLAQIKPEDVKATMQSPSGDTITGTKLTNVAPAKLSDDSKDAVNGSQLKKVANTLGLELNDAKDDFKAPVLNVLKDAKGSDQPKPVTVIDAVNGLTEQVNAGINFGASNTTSGKQQLGSKLDVVASDKVDGQTYSTNNLTTEYVKDAEGNGKITISMKEKPVFKEVTADKIIAKNGLNVGDIEITQAKPDVITKGSKPTKALDLGGTTLTNIADNLNDGNGTSEKAPADVNGSNIASVNDVLNTGWNLQVDGVEKDFVKSYDTVNFKGENGIKVKHNTANGINDIIIALESADFGKGNNGTSSGATNGFITAQKVEEELDKSGFTLTASGKDGSLVQRGESVDLKNTDKNLVITKDKLTNDVNFDLADKVNVKESLTVGNTVSISKNGIDAGKKQITNLASGLVDKDGKAVTDPHKAVATNAVNAGDLATVQDNVNGNVANINNINKIIGGTDTNGKPVDVSDALKTYDVEGQTATNNNTVVSAIKNMNEGGIKYFHTNDDSGQKVGGAVANTEDSSASGKNSTAIGRQASATAENTIAFGHGSQATAENSIAIGTGNIVNAKRSGAFGDPSYISAKAGKDGKGSDVEGSYSVGNDNVINSSNTFVLGNNVNNSGKKDTDGKPVAQGDTVENSIYLGNQTTATKGNRAGTQNLDKQGKKGKTTTAGDRGKVESATVGGITYGGFAGAQANGVVSVGASGNERRIQNVAAGEISKTSTDAINGSQLHATNRKIAKLSNKLGDMKSGITAGVAGAYAAAALGQPHDPGASSVGVAVGNFQGESALSLGISTISDNGKWILKGMVTHDTQNHTGAGASVNYQW
ncbi:YadA-like family protein [Phocoenobacter atlanticus]|uniref:YadA-like family protein n=1 Tax=Phocoenobacter atlanticus TaxID=3416742 RepID=UPI00276730C7|nr:YadA-like family protein [Pasteurella atlantica]MDP8100674.1 ESPR-type extended signal peptide-containing protein [Pasteurella atlantica]